MVLFHYFLWLSSIPLHILPQLFLKIFLNLFFSWREISLRCCVSFCHTTTESVIIMCLSSASYASLLPHPTPLGRHRAADGTPCAHSASPALSFTCGRVCMSALLSQFLPPSPSPAASTGPFSTSASLFLP